MSQPLAAHVDLFGKVPIFEGLSESQLERLARVSSRRRAEAGDAIIREGDVGDSLYILVSGAVEITKTMTLVTKQNLSKVEKTLVHLDGSEPAFFGEMGMLEKAERSATVVAAGACVLYEITRQDLEELAAADPELGYKVVANVARVISSRLRQANKDILKLATALSVALGNR